MQAGLRNLTTNQEGFSELFGPAPGNREAESKAADLVTKFASDLTARAEQEIGYLPYRS